MSKSTSHSTKGHWFLKVALILRGARSSVLQMGPQLREKSLRGREGFCMVQFPVVHQGSVMFRLTLKLLWNIKGMPPLKPIWLASAKDLRLLGCAVMVNVSPLGATNNSEGEILPTNIHVLCLPDSKYEGLSGTENHELVTVSHRRGSKFPPTLASTLGLAAILCNIFIR